MSSAVFTSTVSRSPSSPANPEASLPPPTPPASASTETLSKQHWPPEQFIPIFLMPITDSCRVLHPDQGGANMVVARLSIAQMVSLPSRPATSHFLKCV